jgi:hypothetical protein
MNPRCKSCGGRRLRHTAQTVRAAEEEQTAVKAGGASDKPGRTIEDQEGTVKSRGPSDEPGRKVEAGK